MGLRIHDLTELGYGGAVTALTMWDDRRIASGKITKKQLHKKASVWGYGVIGLGSIVSNLMRKPRGWEPYTERVVHGFIYDFPRMLRSEVIPALSKGNPGSSGTGAEKLLSSGGVTSTVNSGNKSGVRSRIEF